LIWINLASRSKFVDPQVFCKFHRQYRVWRTKDVALIPPERVGLGLTA